MADAEKPTVTIPGRQKPVQQKPVEQQSQHHQGRGQEEGQDRHQQPLHIHPQPAGAEQEVHGGYVYKPLADCPTQGTVRDLLTPKAKKTSALDSGAQSQGDPQEQGEGRPPDIRTLCRKLELPQHMTRWNLVWGGGGHHW